MRKTGFVLAASLFLATAAYADFFEGTISDIDRHDSKLAFTRADNAERMEVKVKDTTTLDLVRLGSPVRVQADKDLIGWTATSIQVPQDKLNLPDERLLKQAESTYMYPEVSARGGISANEAISNEYSNPVAQPGTEISVRHRAVY